MGVGWFGSMYTPDQPTILARTDAWKRPLLLHPADRRAHLLVIGKTGVGKSTLMLRMILADIHAGRGVVFLDPHGQAVQDLLDHIPRSRINDVVLFAPADREYPIGYNILAGTLPERRDFVAASVVSAFHALWSDSWGPRLEYILRCWSSPTPRFWGSAGFSPTGATGRAPSSTWPIPYWCVSGATSSRPGRIATRPRRSPRSSTRWGSFSPPRSATSSARTPTSSTCRT